ncbi:MAG TPA: hypothetical protein VF824_06275 [Thermoanaerobaculia bacterium]|jgi:anti-sigma factor RsiW
MTDCRNFRERFAPGTDDAALLAHLRACDRCLDYAAHIDADVMFRALGGEELVPPGGVDAFVDDVMRQVRVRGAETAVQSSHKVLSWPRRFAIAAAVAAGITGAMVVYRADAPAIKPAPALVAHAAAPARTLTTKPVVETYDSNNATIVEVPTGSADDVKIVMIFDESLPADL